MVGEVEVELGQFRLGLHDGLPTDCLVVVHHLLLLEDAVVQVRQDLIVGQHLYHQHQLVLFLEVLERTVLHLLTDADLFLELLDTSHEELLHLALGIDYPGLPRQQLTVAETQLAVLFRQLLLVYRELFGLGVRHVLGQLIGQFVREMV